MGFSIALSVLMFPVFFDMLPAMLMTGGPILALLFKEVFRSNEFYFYYNKGVSKYHLIITTIAISMSMGLVLFVIFSLW
jgi:hypothetical protein